MCVCVRACVCVCVCVCMCVCVDEKGLAGTGGEERIAGTHRDEVFKKHGVRCGISGDIHGY